MSEPGEPCDGQSVCGGRRHVLEGGRWVECSCLAGGRARRAWRAARIPVRFDSETWQGFGKRFRVRGQHLRILAGRLKCGGGDDLEGGLVLHGDPEGREHAAALCLRAAIAGGLSAELLELPRLIDHEFRRESEDVAPGDPFLRGLVAARLGIEPRHQWNRLVLEKLLRVRRDARLPTLLVAPDPSGIGPAYSSEEVHGDLAARFISVDVQRAP